MPFTLSELASFTNVDLRRLRLRLGDFFVKMWLVNAFLRLILPEPVSLKRFLAPLLDFIFGITSMISSFLIINRQALNIRVNTVLFNYLMIEFCGENTTLIKKGIKMINKSKFL